MPMATPDERTRAYKLRFVPVQQLLDAGRLPDALTELERVTAADPECAQAHNDLAVLYHAAGRLSDADRESRRAIEIDPFHADIRENRDAIVAAIGNAAPAPSGFATSPMTAIAPAPATPPRTPLALDGAPTYREALRRSEALLAAGQLDAAVAEIERYVEREPATAEAWNDLGVLHRDGGRAQAARAALIVALTIEPHNRQAGYNLTRVLLEMGHHQEALRTLEPLLMSNPRDLDALTLAADISLALGQVSDACAFLRSALAVDPSNVELAVRLTTVAASAPPPAASLITVPTYALPATLAPVAVTPAPIPAPARAAVAETARVLEYDPRVRLVTPSDTYDAVTCRTPLDRLPNPIAALTEMVRILRPGGKLWIDLGGPIEVIKHGGPSHDNDSAGAASMPAAWAR